MAIGQGVLRGVLDVGALDAVESRLEQREVRRSAEHAACLRDVLELHRLHTLAGHGLATTALVALSLRCAEHRATELLVEAQLLASLPGALEALECGLLTVEQSRVILSQLGPLPDHVQLIVWERLRDRLVADEDGGIVRPRPGCAHC